MKRAQEVRRRRASRAKGQESRVCEKWKQLGVRLEFLRAARLALMTFDAKKFRSFSGHTREQSACSELRREMKSRPAKSLISISFIHFNSSPFGRSASQQLAFFFFFSCCKLNSQRGLGRASKRASGRAT